MKAQRKQQQETTTHRSHVCRRRRREAEEDNIPGSRKSQKHKLNLKLKVLKSSAVFLRFSIARIRPKFEKKFPDFYTWFK
jgi:hypothetical protein